MLNYLLISDPPSIEGIPEEPRSIVVVVEAAVDIAAGVAAQRTGRSRSSGNLPLFDCLDLAGAAEAFQTAPAPMAVEAAVGSVFAVGSVAVEERDKLQQGDVQRTVQVAGMVADRKIPTSLARHKAKKTRPEVEVAVGHPSHSKIPLSNWSTPVGEVAVVEADVAHTIQQKDLLRQGRGPA